MKDFRIFFIDIYVWKILVKDSDYLKIWISTNVNCGWLYIVHVVDHEMDLCAKKNTMKKIKNSKMKL